MRLSIASEYKAAGFSEDDVLPLFEHFDDFDEEKCRVQIQSADPSRTALCKTIRQLGYCLPECPKLLKGEIIDLKEVLEFSQKTDLLFTTIEDMERLIKFDLPSKLLSVCTGLSASLLHPLNSNPRGPSSIGKTYTSVTPLKQYFSLKDVWLLVGLSPKALVHQHGVLMDENDEPILPQDKPMKPGRSEFARGEDGANEYHQAMETYRTELREWNERLANSYYLIDLQDKIIVFLEAPPIETIQMLLPILSHDTWRSEYKYTDTKTMRTITIVLQGWPASICLESEQTYMKTYATRAYSYTPETDITKIEAVIGLLNDMLMNPWNYQDDTEETRMIRGLIASIKQQVKELKLQVVVPFNLSEYLPKSIPRDMRDFRHFGSLLQAITLFHLFQRPVLLTKKGRYVVSSIDDVIIALTLHFRVLETTRAGIEENLLKFYWNFVAGGKEWRVNELIDLYNMTAERKIGSSTMYKMLEALCKRDYVTSERSKLDKRLKLYSPLKDKKMLEIVRFLKDLTSLRLKLEKDLEGWRKNVGIQEGSFSKFFFLNGSIQLTEIGIEEAETMIKKESLGEYPIKFQRFISMISPLKSEIKAKDVGSLKKPTISDVSKTLSEPVEGPCSICGKRTLIQDGMCSECEKEHGNKSKGRLDTWTKRENLDTPSPECIPHSHLEPKQGDSTKVTRENAEDKKKGISAKEVDKIPGESDEEREERERDERLTEWLKKGMHPKQD